MDKSNIIHWLKPINSLIRNSTPIQSDAVSTFIFSRKPAKWPEEPDKEEFLPEKDAMPEKGPGTDRKTKNINEKNLP